MLWLEDDHRHQLFMFEFTHNAMYFLFFSKVPCQLLQQGLSIIEDNNSV